MMSPGMFGITPEQMEAGKEVGQHLTMEVRKSRKRGTVEVRYIKANPNEDFDLGMAVDKLAEQLIWGHRTFFGMTGKRIDLD